MGKSRPATWLSPLAALSLVPAAILCCGYFSRLGPTFIIVRTVPAVSVQSYSLELDKGRIRFWAQVGVPAPAVAPGIVAGHSIRWRVQPEWPDLKRCFWDFDNHSLSPVLPGAYIIAFPIWCLLLPCLIAPVIWLRLRKRPSPIGFDVITGSSTRDSRLA